MQNIAYTVTANSGLTLYIMFVTATDWSRGGVALRLLASKRVSKRRKPNHRWFTCRRRVDLHHDAVDLRLREVEFFQELQLGPLSALQLADGLRHRLVVLPLVVDRVRQDEAEVQRAHGGIIAPRQ